MNPGSVSCVIPVFNGARWLRDTLDGILEQTHQPLELILVDDGSTDDTPKVAAGYGDRIRYVRQTNAGPAAARNRGISEAAGDLIAFGDADDRWHPERLARQAGRLRERPDVDACLCWIEDFWIEELVRDAAALEHGPRTRAGYVTQCGLVRRSALDRVGPFNERLRYRFGPEWQIRARDRGIVFDLIPEALVFRRIHRGNRSRGRTGEDADALLRSLKRSLDHRRSR